MQQEDIVKFPPNTEQEYELVELTGDEGTCEQHSTGYDLAELYAVRDHVQAHSLMSGRTMTERRFGVRPLVQGR